MAIENTIKTISDTSVLIEADGAVKFCSDVLGYYFIDKDKYYQAAGIAHVRVYKEISKEEFDGRNPQ